MRPPDTELYEVNLVGGESKIQEPKRPGLAIQMASNDGIRCGRDRCQTSRADDLRRAFDVYVRGATVRAFRQICLMIACATNAAADIVPIQSNPRFRQPQNSQNSAAAEIVPKISTALLTSSNSLELRAFVGTVPIQLSSGVRSQNSPNTVIVSGTSGHAVCPASSPADAPVTNGTSRMPHAPCSRGKISDSRRPGALLMPLS